MTEAADYSLSPSVVVVGGSSDGSEQEGQRASVQPKLMPGAYHDNTKSHPSTQRVHSHEVLLVSHKNAHMVWQHHKEYA